MTHCYRQLRLDDREALFRMKDARLPVSRIAERLGRHPSTIYRELRRNEFAPARASSARSTLKETRADVSVASVRDISN